MLVATLPGPTQQDVKKQIFNFQGQADIFELRPDLYAFSDLDWISAADGPFLVAGGPAIPEIDYIDIPIEKWREQDSSVQVICSYHNYEETPADLEEIFERMLRCDAYLYKVVTMARSALDGFRMLQLVRCASQRGIRIVGHCMGSAGQFTRVLGKIMGNHWTYCSVGESVAPGQMRLDEMRDIFRIETISPSTQIFALIGDPVELSRGHLYHNHFFIEKNIDAVYVKIPLKSEELQQGFAAMQKLGFKGLSVTMPLKEKVGALCTPSVAVCNTIAFGNEVKGANTDGEAAIALIRNKMTLEGKRALIIGWGGVGKEIATRLQAEGVDATILNRTFGGSVLPLESWNTLDLDDYSIIVQATSVGMGDPGRSPVDPSRLLKKHLVLEAISNPVETALVRTAREKGCGVITGVELFEEQAHQQHHYWGTCSC